VVNVGDEFALWDRIEVLQRVCNKPGTKELQVPSWPMRLVKLLTFAFADTSEGKSVEDLKNEIVAAHGNVAIVSTLVWAIAFDIFYNCAYSTFCLSDAVNPLPADHFCVTSGGFDLDGWRLNAFYCFSGLSAIFLLFSTVFAVIQIIMVTQPLFLLRPQSLHYRTRKVSLKKQVLCLISIKPTDATPSRPQVFEMSDELELEIFLELIGGATALPGIFLVIGIVCIPVPITLYMIWNSMHGCYFQTRHWIEGHPSANLTVLVMSYVAEAGVLFLAMTAILWWIPGAEGGETEEGQWQGQGRGGSVCGGGCHA
jgi:hypothetical protein